MAARLRSHAGSEDGPSDPLGPRSWRRQEARTLVSRETSGAAKPAPCLSPWRQFVDAILRLRKYPRHCVKVRVPSATLRTLELAGR